MKAKTYVLDDLIVCVLRNGFTAIEQTMVESGRPTGRRDARRLSAMMGIRYQRRDRGADRAPGRRLPEPGTPRPHHVEVFFVDRPLDGFGAAELIEPKRIYV